MADIVQKVKYQVEVSTTELDQFKTAVDNTNAAIGHLNTSFRNLSTSIDQGMLKAFATLNGRISRFNTVAPAAVDSLEKMAAPLGGLATSMTKLAEQFGHFATSTNRALDDLRKFNAEMGRTKQATNDITDVNEKGGRRLGLAWLKAYGIMQSARYVAVGAFNAIKDGAQQLDLDDILARQVSGFEQQIRRAQELTAGIVDRGSLTRSFALMSSFGIPMDKFAENMELVQKMAIRTGQSAEFLTESFSRGISRLSPLILDNLGIQVSLSEANNTYANATGRVVTELTKEERIAALLDHVLAKLQERTKGVSLEVGSAAASIARFEVSLKDAWDSVKKFAGTVQLTLDFMAERAPFERAAQGLDPLVDALRLTQDLISKTGGSGGELDTLTANYGAMSDALRGLKGLDGDTLFKLFSGASDGISRFMSLKSQLPEAAAAFQIVLDSFRAARGELRDYPLSDTGSAGIGGAIAIYKQNLLIARDAMVEIRQMYGGALSAADILALKAKEEANARQRSKDAIIGANAAAKTFGIPFAVALAANFDQIAKRANEYKENIVEAGKTLAFISVANKALLDMDNARLGLAALDNTQAERMFNLRSGQLVSEVNLNQITAERGEVLTELSKVEKKLAEDRFDNESRLERDRLLNHLSELNRKRDEAQTQMLLDRNMIDSFKSLTKEKLSQHKLVFTMMREAAKALGNSEEVQNMTNLISAIDALLTKPKGGGGAVRELADDFKKATTELKRFWSEGEVAYEKSKVFWDNAQKMKGAFKEFMDGGLEEKHLRIGNFQTFGVLGSTMFGAATPEEWEAQVDRFNALVDQYRELSRLFGEDYANEKLSDMLGVEDFHAAMMLAKDDLERWKEHLKEVVGLSEDLHRVSYAMQSFRDGMEGLFGSDVIAMMAGFNESIDKFSTALAKNAGAYELVNAAMPAIRAFTVNIIKNRKAQAAVEALMQGAAAWAAYAEGNIPGGIMHTAAAGMYLAVAGGALRLPKGKGKDTNPDDSKVKSQAVKGGDRHFHWHGQIATTEAERGAMIREMIRESERAGI